MKRIAPLCVFLVGTTLLATAEDHWQSDPKKCSEPGQTDPHCKPSAGPGFTQGSARIESTPSAQNIAMLKQHAANGDAEAQYNLGNLYAFGQGVTQDYARAAIWYREAAQQGNADAQFALGDLYEDGNGVPQDYSQAATWYRKAADQGDVVAQLDLGVLYEHGHGVPRDYAEAYFWLDLSAAGKVPGLTPEFTAAFREGMRKTRDEAASHLTPADLSRAQERARKWFEDHPPKRLSQ
jgi:TPR repeat protein